jgi:hypothetical protein
MKTGKMNICKEQKLILKGAVLSKMNLCNAKELDSETGFYYYLVNLHVYHYAGNNPVKYTDPDGNELKQPLILQQIDTAVKIAKFIIENKDAIQKIGIGVGKILLGADIATLGTAGSVGITVGFSGATTLGGVALAEGAIVAGGALVGTGIADVLDGIVMMSKGNNDGIHLKHESQKSYNRNDKNDIKDALNKISNETGQELNIGKKEEETIHKAIQEMKGQVNLPESYNEPKN